MGLSIGMLRQALSHLRLARVGIVGLGWAILVLSGPAFSRRPRGNLPPDHRGGSMTWA